MASGVKFPFNCFLISFCRFLQFGISTALQKNQFVVFFINCSRQRSIAKPHRYSASSLILMSRLNLPRKTLIDRNNSLNLQITAISQRYFIKVQVNLRPCSLRAVIQEQHTERDRRVIYVLRTNLERRAGSMYRPGTSRSVDYKTDVTADSLLSRKRTSALQMALSRQRLG